MGTQTLRFSLSILILFFFPSSFLRFGLFNVHRYRSTFYFKTYDFHMPFRLTSDEVCIALTLRQAPVYSCFG